MTESVKLAHSLDSKIRTQDVILEENVLFESLLLPENIFRGLSDAGFQKPSPIQIKALPMGRCGFDLTVKSKSGTGKTLVFGIIALETVKLQKNSPQTLILVPTREIAVQIEDVLKNIGKHIEGLSVQSFIGGLPLSSDKTKCKSCHIAVGTPGRIKQLIQEGNLASNSIKLFVLDEADKLLENTFQNDINVIFNSLPDRKQVIMCSATYPNELESFLHNYMLSPTFVSAELETPLLLGLKQFVRILTSSPNVVQQTKVKNEELLKIISTVSFTQCLIFSNYQTRAESISNFLNRNGWNSTFMSGAQNQTERLSSLASLKEFKCKILISTDLTSRGIDAANVDLVINYDVPVDAMTYLHRMGRAGRYGSTGNCINLALAGQETKLLQNILGIIGGHKLSMPILDASFNVKNTVILKDNVLIAEVPNNIKEFTDKCKAEIIEMKKLSSKRSEKKTKDCKNTSTKGRVPADEKLVKQVIEENIGDTDITSVLEQLAPGTLDLESKMHEYPSSPPKLGVFGCKQDKSYNIDLDPISILQQLCQDEISEDKLDDKKRKRSQDFPDSQKEVALKQEQSKEETFCKNKALLTVAKTLSNVELCEEDTDYITEYLGLLKAKEKSEANELKKNTGLKDTEKNSDDVKKDNYGYFLENIFSCAYKCQVLDTHDKWQDHLPEEEIKKLDDKYVANNRIDHDYAELGVDSYEENDEYGEGYDYYEDYDFEMEKEIEVNIGGESSKDTSQDPNDYSFMKWIPVEPENSQQNYKKLGLENKTSVSDPSTFIQSSNQVNIYNQASTADIATNESSYYCERFNPYYEYCSSNLWETGLNFDSVQKFDEWFYYGWQNQMAAVRNFIQKKIYVEEITRCHSK